MRRAPLLCGLAAAAALSSSGEIRAAAPPAAGAGAAEQVGVLPIRVEGELPEHVVADMEKDIEGALQRGEHRVVSAERVEALSPQARRCDISNCYQTTAQASGARYLVRADVLIEGRDYTFKLQLIDGISGESMGDAEAMCDICGHDEARESLANEVATLSRKITAKASKPPTLVLHTAPEGSQVRFDGELLGITPLEVPVEAGDHDLRIEKPGFITQRRRVAFVEGVTETMYIDLEDDPNYIDPETARRIKLMRTLGWAGVGAGAGALVGGAVLMALDKRPITSDCSGENVDIEGNCRYRYATLEGGVALTVTGVALVVTGATLLVLQRKQGRRGAQRASRRRVQPALSPGGFALRF